MPLIFVTDFDIFYSKRRWWWEPLGFLSLLLPLAKLLPNSSKRHNPNIINKSASRIPGKENKRESQRSRWDAHGGGMPLILNPEWPRTRSGQSFFGTVGLGKCSWHVRVGRVKFLTWHWPQQHYNEAYNDIPLLIYSMPWKEPVKKGISLQKK